MRGPPGQHREQASRATAGVEDPSLTADSSHEVLEQRQLDWLLGLGGREVAGVRVGDLVVRIAHDVLRLPGLHPDPAALLAHPSSLPPVSGGGTP